MKKIQPVNTPTKSVATGNWPGAGKVASRDRRLDYNRGTDGDDRESKMDRSFREDIGRRKEFGRPSERPKRLAFSRGIRSESGGAPLIKSLIKSVASSSVRSDDRKSYPGSHFSDRKPSYSRDRFQDRPLRPKGNRPLIGKSRNFAGDSARAFDAEPDAEIVGLDLFSGKSDLNPSDVSNDSDFFKEDAEFETGRSSDVKSEAVVRPDSLLFFVSCARGLEDLLQEEILELKEKLNLKVEKLEKGMGGVECVGDSRTMVALNVWLRTASAVLIQLRSFSAKHPAMLYDQVRRIPWETWLTPQMTFSVETQFAKAGSGAEKMNHTVGAALKIKDAICDRMRRESGDRPNIERDSPDVLIQAFMRDGMCRLSIHTSGFSLHERGYRMTPPKSAANEDLRSHSRTGARQNDRANYRTSDRDSDFGNSRISDRESHRRTDREAPLKENLAAAIVKSTGFSSETAIFVDGMCGSGTMAIEAAMMMRGLRPRVTYRPFAFETWPGFDSDVLAEIKNHVEGKKEKYPVIVANERLKVRLDYAFQSAKKSHVQDHIDFINDDFFELKGQELLKRRGLTGQGILVLNIPYGKRIAIDRPNTSRFGDDEDTGTMSTVESEADKKASAEFHKRLGDALKKNWTGFDVFVFTGNLEGLKSIGLKTNRRVQLYNGPIDCRLLHFKIREGRFMDRDQKTDGQSGEIRA